MWQPPVLTLIAILPCISLLFANIKKIFNTIEHVSGARHITCIFSCVLMISLGGNNYFHSHLADEETEAHLWDSAQVVQARSLLLGSVLTASFWDQSPIDTPDFLKKARICEFC